MTNHILIFDFLRNTDRLSEAMTEVAPVMYGVTVLLK